MSIETSERGIPEPDQQYDVWFAKQVGLNLTTEAGRQKYAQIMADMNDLHPDAARMFDEIRERRSKEELSSEKKEVPAEDGEEKDKGAPTVYAWSEAGAAKRKEDRMRLARALDAKQGTNINPDEDGWEERLERAVADLGI